jgi:hypothetical protein
MTQVVIVDEEVGGKVKEAVAKMLGIKPEQVEMLTVIPRGMPRRLIASRFGVNPGHLSQSPTVGGLVEAIQKEAAKPNWARAHLRLDQLAGLRDLEDYDGMVGEAATA